MDKTQVQPRNCCSILFPMSLVTILVEDNPAIRENLLAAMDELTDLEVVATAETASQAACALNAYNESW
ncbi:MAG TPA: hypothetical protein VEP93_10205, partial [Variovorax sp.]|nr:hypothetical protein [Variovorax sp.]